MKKRTDRLNSLLKEVLSEVIRKDVKNPHVHEFITVTGVDISKDLRHAKVYVSIIGNDQEKSETITALQSASGFIAKTASKKVVMRYFPDLLFKLDQGVDNQMRVEEILYEISQERNKRNHKPSQEDEEPSH